MNKFKMTEKEGVGKLDKSDFLLFMDSRPDGEKIIKMYVQNKILVLATDFVKEVVLFFRSIIKKRYSYSLKNS